MSTDGEAYCRIGDDCGCRSFDADAKASCTEWVEATVFDAPPVVRNPTLAEPFRSILNAATPHIMGEKVITDFVYPPIPTRQFDWAAMLDGYEPDDPSGYGPTETAAIEDLRQYFEDEA